jgi:hypothetical protein
MNLTEEEKEELQRQNDALNRHFQKYFSHLFPSYRQFRGLTYKNGDPVSFNIGDNKNLYRFWQSKKDDTRYCYTPWKDTQNWYWCFTYRDRGDRLKVEDAVRFRKRKAAKDRALKRYMNE